MRFNGVEYSIGGDLIIRIGTTPIADAQDVSRAVAARTVGQRVPFTILRDGKSRRVVVLRLSDRPA